MLNYTSESTAAASLIHQWARVGAADGMHIAGDLEMGCGMSAGT
jgi:hypothetical protein